MQGKRLDHFGDQARQVAFEVCRVPTVHDVIRDECEIVAYENAGTERDADGEGLVVAVSQTNRILIARVGAAKRQKDEVPRSILGDAVVLLDDFMAETVDFTRSTTRKRGIGTVIVLPAVFRAVAIRRKELP
jgi:hypothetical protein